MSQVNHYESVLNRYKTAVQLDAEQIKRLFEQTQSRPFKDYSECLVWAESMHATIVSYKENVRRVVHFEALIQEAERVVSE